MLTLEEALRVLAPFARDEGFDWDGVRALLSSDARGSDVVEALRRSIETGTITSTAWRNVTGVEAPRDFTVAFGGLWDHLVEAGFSSEADGMPSPFTLESLRLWGYTSEWVLLSQDEDLLLMSERMVPLLLEVARDESCPKRGYMLQIVAHWARDEAYAAAGSERFRDFVKGLVRFVPAARQTGANDLGEYLERLASYATPGTVQREAALQRGLDLTRCHQPKAEDVFVERDGKNWIVQLPGYTKKTLKISASDGQIR